MISEQLKSYIKQKGIENKYINSSLHSNSELIIINRKNIINNYNNKEIKLRQEKKDREDRKQFEKEIREQIEKEVGKVIRKELLYIFKG